MNLALCFFYIFSFLFNKNFFVDSSMVVAAYLMITAIVKPRFFKEFIINIKSRYFINILIVYCVLNIWSLCTMLINGSRDFSFLKTFFHMFYYIVVGIWLYSYYRYKECEKNVVNYIIMSFVIQTIIQWSAFLIPGVKVLLNTTKNSSTIAKGMEYGGARANALSGSDFFGLSAAYALVFIIFFSDRNTIFKDNRPLKWLLYFFLVTGTFFAGRTGYVGLLIGLFYYMANSFLKKKKRKIRLSEAIAGIAVIGVSISIISIFINEFRKTNLYNALFRFTFQMLFNKVEQGTFSTTSFSHLMNDMYFRIPISTFLIGDAQYTSNTMHYYMNTDSGYMRPILFFGFIGFIFLIFMQLLIIDFNRGGEKLLKAFVVFAYFILSVKGEMFVWNCIPLTVTVLFSKKCLDSVKFIEGSQN